jgi:hypothetical protein
VVEETELPQEKKKEYNRRIDLIPDLLSHEIFLICLGTFVMLAILYFRLFASPLETQANPQSTPLDTKAPWYFWWLQGMLKIDPATIIENLVNPILHPLLALFGVDFTLELSTLLNSKFIMGLVIPPGLIITLMAIPYIDRNPSRLARKRGLAIAWGLAWVFIVIALSFMGTPQFGIETPPATRIIQDLAPEEGIGPLREIPFEEFVQGIYAVTPDYGDDLCPKLTYQPEPDTDPSNVVIGCPHLTAVFNEFSEKLLAAEADGLLPDLSASFIIEDFQFSLVRVTPHVEWTDPETGERKVYERNYFLHRDRTLGE